MNNNWSKAAEEFLSYNGRVDLDGIYRFNTPSTITDSEKYEICCAWIKNNPEQYRDFICEMENWFDFAQDLMLCPEIEDRNEVVITCFWEMVKVMLEEYAEIYVEDLKDDNWYEDLKELESGRVESQYVKREAF